MYCTNKTQTGADLLKTSFMERVKTVTVLGGLASFLCCSSSTAIQQQQHSSTTIQQQQQQHSSSTAAQQHSSLFAVCSTGLEIVEVGVTLVPYFEVSNENPTTNVNTVLSTTTTTTTTTIIIIIIIIIITIIIIIIII